MVTVTNYHLRQSKGGKDYVSFTLQEDREMIQFQKTGKIYATVENPQKLPHSIS